MTPIEKANEIFYKNYEITKNYYQAKECSLIAADYILKSFFYVGFINQEKGITTLASYFEEVKQELQNKN
jgi:hypothetical protein